MQDQKNEYLNGTRSWENLNPAMQARAYCYRVHQERVRAGLEAPGALAVEGGHVSEDEAAQDPDEVSWIIYFIRHG